MTSHSFYWLCRAIREDVTSNQWTKRNFWFSLSSAKLNSIYREVWFFCFKRFELKRETRDFKLESLLQRENRSRFKLNEVFIRKQNLMKNKTNKRKSILFAVSFGEIIESTYLFVTGPRFYQSQRLKEMIELDEFGVDVLT